MTHPVTWLIWLLAATLPALLTRNPLYLTLLLLASGVTYMALERRSPAARSWRAFVKLGVVLLLFAVPSNALTAHQGRLVLFRLPQSWPIIGGPITGEAMLYGLSSGLSLLTLLLIFATFNSAVDQARLLRMTPPYLYQAGVIAAIAVAFVPQMMIAAHEIREAQRIRGHRFRGLRDLLPLWSGPSRWRSRWRREASATYRPRPRGGRRSTAPGRCWRCWRWRAVPSAAVTSRRDGRWAWG
jgi:energy-coupling factor transport system permease protein